MAEDPLDRAAKRSTPSGSAGTRDDFYSVLSFGIPKMTTAIQDPKAHPPDTLSGYAEGYLRRQNLIVLALLCTLTLVLGCLRGATKPFWFDEVATAHIASAPSWQEMLQRSRLVDLHPPLEPTLVRLSFAIFGPHEFAGRLPSVLAFTITVGSLFLFLRRRLPMEYAAFGALLPLCSGEVAFYATEARPYGLLLAGVSSAVLAYDSVARKQFPGLARCGLLLSLTVMLQAHLFGVFAAAAFVLAEIVRSVRLRRVDTFTWITLLLPWLGCATYIPLLHIQAAGQGSPMVYEEQYRTSMKKGLLFYHQFLYMPLAPLTKLAAIALLCVPSFPIGEFRRFLGLMPGMGTLFSVLLLTPVLVTLMLYLRAPDSGFFLRYGIAAVCPALIVFAMLIAWRSGSDRRIGLFLLLAAAVCCAVNFSDTPASIRSVMHEGLLVSPRGTEDVGGVDKLCLGVPLVMDDATQFIEADFHLKPGVETRMVYLTDRAESLRLDHQDVLESAAGMARVFETPHHVFAGRPFLMTHPKFLLLGRPNHHRWVYDEMMEQHARIEPVGTYRFAGKNSDVFLVSQSGTANDGVAASCSVADKY